MIPPSHMQRFVTPFRGNQSQFGSYSEFQNVIGFFKVFRGLNLAVANLN